MRSDKEIEATEDGAETGFGLGSGSGFLLDKHGREILVGDVLKVFHFVAAVRREKLYMYKHVIAREMLGTPPRVPALKISHLNLSDGGYYRELLNGRQLQDYEIVQGYGADGVCFKDRPKRGQNVEMTDGYRRSRLSTG